MTVFTPSPIQWTDVTANFVTGCSKVSPGCVMCYAEAMAKRLKAMGNPRYTNGFDVTIHEDKLDALARLRKPRRIFINSMSDWLHDEVPDDFVRRMVNAMNGADRHVYQLLTKRGERLASLGPSLPWQGHLWAGVSVESEAPYNARGGRPTDRIGQLLDCGATSIFLSMEPLVGPVPSLLEYLATGRIGWVIVGGESGPRSKVRPMDPEWARDIVHACQEAGVPVFVKQMGTAWAVANDARDRKGGDPAKWPEDLRVREYPASMQAHLDRARAGRRA